MRSYFNVILIILVLALGALAWTFIPEGAATATPLPGVGNTRLAPDLTTVQEYETPTPLTPWNQRLRKTQMWCERNADNLTYVERLNCGHTPESYQRDWEKKTQVWLEECRWRNQPPGTPCPSFPLRTPDPYKYTVTPEPLS